jgi:hypothetical protein
MSAAPSPSPGEHSATNLRRATALAFCPAPALWMFEQAVDGLTKPQPTQGGDRRSEEAKSSGHVRLKRQYGNSVKDILARLDRDGQASLLTADTD